MLLVFPFIASADEVHDFDMDIYINSNGDAYITEVWDATSDMGSEFYHSYYMMVVILVISVFLWIISNIHLLMIGM